MTLQYLDFDYSEDDLGNGTLDALASVLPDRQAAAQTEAQQVLDWAHAEFGPAQALEDGGTWHYALQCTQETDIALGGQRCVLALTLTGSTQFCLALMERFNTDAYGA